MQKTSEELRLELSLKGWGRFFKVRIYNRRYVQQNISTWLYCFNAKSVEIDGFLNY